MHTGSMRPLRASSHRSRQNSASALLPFTDDRPPLPTPCPDPAGLRQTQRAPSSSKRSIMEEPLQPHTAKQKSR